MLETSVIARRPSSRIYVGAVPIGDAAPIAVQSMTNTSTTDVVATLQQIVQLAHAGADFVRVSLPTLAAAEAFKSIQSQSPLPLIADIHFDYRIAVKAAEYGAAGLRINPGNIGRESRIRSVVSAAREHNIPIRIGVNAGSLEEGIRAQYGEPSAKALVASALRQVDMLDKLNFSAFKVSVKASDVMMSVKAYRMLAAQITQPLHLGITETGGLRSGTVKSALGIGLLLAEGIGDTLRVSLAADPVEEVKVAFDLLGSLQLRSRGINFIACPSCARQEFDVIAAVNALEQRLSDISFPLDVSIIGCVVNGPGEAAYADLGLAGAQHFSAWYVAGQRQQERIKNDELVDQLEVKIRAYVAEKMKQAQGAEEGVRPICSSNQKEVT